MKYYLYRHIRLDKNEPFYIGIGTKPKKFISITGISINGIQIATNRKIIYVEGTFGAKSL